MDGIKDFEIARLKAIDFTLATGKEYGFLLDEREGIVGEVAGTERSVNFEPLAALVPGRWVVHTHPNNTSLSVEDSLVAVTGQAKGIVVVGLDGSIFTASAHKMSLGLNLYLWHVQHLAMAMARKLIEEEVLREDDAHFAMSHEMNLQLAKEGLFTYTYELSDRAKGMWERYEALKAGGWYVG
jgi:hypothetical protein